VKSTLFKIQEFVPEHIYLKRGEKAWELIDDRLILTAETLKGLFPQGTMTINNWLWAGNRTESGLRTPESKYYSETSQHSFGRAIDCIFSEYSAQEVRTYIIDNPGLFPYITGIEDYNGMGWVHIDVRNSDLVRIFKK